MNSNKLIGNLSRTQTQNVYLIYNQTTRKPFLHTYFFLDFLNIRLIRLRDIAVSGNLRSILTNIT